jgi:hypothetical protein
MSAVTEESLLTRGQVAKRLGVSVASVRRMEESMEPKKNLPHPCEVCGHSVYEHKQAAECDECSCPQFEEKTNG